MRRDDDEEEVDDDDEGGGYGTFIVTFASRMKTIASFILVILWAFRSCWWKTFRSLRKGGEGGRRREKGRKKRGKRGEKREERSTTPRLLLSTCFS